VINIRNKYPYEEYHKEIDGILYKKCVHHQKYFPEENCWFPCTSEYFYKNKKNLSDGLYPECKRCSISKSSEWQKDNHEVYKENMRKYNHNPTPKTKQYRKKMVIAQILTGYQSEWRKNNPDKCKQYASQHRCHDITTTEEDAMLKVFNYKCAYCGMTLEEHKNKYKEKLHKDHVDHEGYNDIRNCVPACKSCNCKKWQHNMKEWYENEKYYNENRYNKIIWWITEGYKDYIKEKPPYIITRKHNEDKIT